MVQPNALSVHLLDSFTYSFVVAGGFVHLFVFRTNQKRDGPPIRRWALRHQKQKNQN